MAKVTVYTTTIQVKLEVDTPDQMDARSRTDEFLRRLRELKLPEGVYIIDLPAEADDIDFDEVEAEVDA